MRKPPLLVRLIFHPDSADAAELARMIHRELNADTVVPSLRVPTTFCPLDDSGSPIDLKLEGATRVFEIPLADDHLAAADVWSSFVADLWERSQGPEWGFAPIQLSGHAWPLDDRLRGVNFARAIVKPGSTRDALVVRRVVTEICRFLHGETPTGEPNPAPIKLFLSHTKLDLNKGLRVMESLTEHLSVTQPVKAWTDSGDIPAGSQFEKEIDEGVQHTSLLCVLTDRYATREWCRREILLAKAKRRPVVVIDALEGKEIRSFPYLGNLPVIRWTGDPQAAVDLVLKETLRDLHTTELLRAWKENDDIIDVRPPELATLVDVKQGSTVLYPDPPLGVEEVRLLTKTGVKVTTPLERVARDRSLKGKAIALSLSESTDIDRCGFDSVHLDEAMLDLSRYLLIKGATLAYGGHLGNEGYTRQLFELVRTHNELEGVEPVDRIVNYLGWPLERPGVKKRAKFKHVAKLKPLPRPVGVDESLHADLVEEPSFFPADRSAEHRYAWARGMTAMRETQIGETRARIVLGGNFGPTDTIDPDGNKVRKWYSGRIPGLLEEVLVSARADPPQPVFLIGAFGGAARLVIDLLENTERQEATWDYQKDAPHAPGMRKLYGDDWWDYPEMVEFLRDRGIAGINPLLSEDDNRELFHTRCVDRMIELILTGLGRLGA